MVSVTLRFSMDYMFANRSCLITIKYGKSETRYSPRQPRLQELRAFSGREAKVYLLEGKERGNSKGRKTETVLNPACQEAARSHQWP